MTYPRLVPPPAPTDQGAPPPSTSSSSSSQAWSSVVNTAIENLGGPAVFNGDMGSTLSALASANTTTWEKYLHWNRSLPLWEWMGQTAYILNTGSAFRTRAGWPMHIMRAVLPGGLVGLVALSRGRANMSPNYRYATVLMPFTWIMIFGNDIRLHHLAIPVVAYLMAMTLGADPQEVVITSVLTGAAVLLPGLPEP